MRQKYKILFEVKISHLYYNHSNANGVELAPSSETEALMRRFRLLYRKTQSGGLVLCELWDNNSEQEPIIPITENLLFHFLVLQKVPVFLNYSGLSFFSKKEKQLCFTNIDKGEKQTLLSIDKEVSESDLYTKTNNTFTYIPKPKTKTVVVNDMNNNVVFQHERKLTTDNSPIEITLPNNAFGMFSVKENKKEETKICTYNANNIEQIGFIKIQQNAVGSNYFLSENHKTYSLTFPVRKTIWKYVLLEKFNSPKLMEVFDVNETIQWKSEMEGNNKVFVSASLLPLYEINPYNFQLVLKNGKSKNKIIFEKLPHPGISNMMKNTEDSFFSVTYVHV